MNTWIKLYRKFTEWEWYGDINCKVVFLHLLLTANWQPKRWRGSVIDVGEVVTGRESLAEAVGITVQQVRTALKKLVESDVIEIDTTNKFTVIKIKNYEKYQENQKNQPTNNQVETQMGETFESTCNSKVNLQITNNQPTNNQQITNNQPHLKNVKKDKNVKNVKKDIYIGVPDELKTAFMEFAEMREAKKKPIMTENTVTRILNRLEKFASSTDEKIAILNQSTDHCWIDVYDLKEKPKKGTGNPYLDMLGDEQ